jgi:hypothetical protein
MSKRYTLHLTEKQARVIVNALDLYSRIGMGQLKEVAYVLRAQNIGAKTDAEIQEHSDQINIIRDRLEALSRYWMNGPGYHSIASQKISDVFRVAWDIQQVVRHRLAWDRNPKGDITVDFDNALKTSKEPLPQIESKDES